MRRIQCDQFGDLLQSKARRLSLANKMQPAQILVAVPTNTIKLLKEGVRLVYRVQDDALIVMVMAVDRREDGVVYQSALARLGATVKALADAAKKKAVTPSSASNRPARKKK